MVEFINKLTESQASDKVHKVLRADPDKKRSQPEKERGNTDSKEEQEKPKDELVLSEDAGNAESEKGAESGQVDEIKIKSKIESNKEDKSPADHIDVKA